MKPLKLEFEGINSFSEHTIIDFEPLTKNGIFGIFGDTGSGKSTILDCINFALYGRVERSKEKTDIINYRCSVAKVSFSFNIVTEGARRTYCIERTIKKDKSGTHKATMYEDGKCIADKPQEVERKVIEVLGLEAEDFRKCIALPQGEFSQFVKSVPRERLQLIERLFSLSKYGDRLKEKISAKQSEAEGEYQNIKGRLSAYEDVSKETLELCEAQLNAAKRRLSELEKSAKAAAESYRKTNALYEKRCELYAAREKLERLNAGSERMEELRKELSVLPLCREAVQLNEELLSVIGAIERCEQSIKSIEEGLSQSAARLQATERQLSEGNYAERTDRLLKLTARYSASVGLPEKLKNTLKRIEELRGTYKKAQTVRSELLKDRAEAENALSELEKLSETQGLADLENFVNVHFKGAILRGEYVAELDYFSNLHAQIEQLYENSKLYKFIDSEIKGRIAEFKQRITDVRGFSLEKVNEQFALLQSAQKLREENEKKKLELTKKIGDYDTKIKEQDGILASIERDGSELRKRADELQEELEDIFGKDCTDYSSAVQAAEKQLSSLRSESKRLSDQIEAEKNSATQQRVALERETANRANLLAERERLLKKLNAAVKGSSFKDAKECKALADKFNDLPDAEKSLAEYDSTVSAITHRIAELQTKEVEGATQERVLDFKAQSERLGEEVLNLNKELAVLTNSLEKQRIRLDEKKVLEGEFSDIEKKKKLIDQLKEITKNNRFLEFIANEYLYDISSLASSTLLKLTDGRYFLTYKDNNFHVGDNFNCGELRGVNTLSGGETFLVSLSLALALSQTICARSLKSIEFFFLDEGFGTLDNTLVDTVMSALEKLKSSAFTIGVISHVEELKHRIDSKITVIKATESHGSTVQVS